MNYQLYLFLAENLSLPLSEIIHQINLGLCKINGKTVTNPLFNLINGLDIELGKTMKFKT